MIPIKSLDDAEAVINSLEVRLQEMRRIVSDHSQRFDTLQSPIWKRIWWWIDGWPWYDLNGTQKHRFWHGNRSIPQK